MSRGDAIYFKVDVDALDGERIGQLKPIEVYTYIFGYWRTAVKYRQYRFNVTKDQHFSCKKLAKSVQIDSRTIASHAEKLFALGLLIQHDDGSVTVEGVRASHPKLGWKEYEPTSRYGDKMVPHLGTTQGYITRVREYESTNVPLGTSDILTTLQDSSNSKTRNPEESDFKNQVDENLSPCPDEKRWSKVDALIASLWPKGVTEDFREQVKWKIYDAVSHYPEVWINEAMMTTRDKQLRIAEGVAPQFTSGPGSYFLGILKKRERKDGGK